MNKISIVISAFNEGENIEDSLRSIRDLAGEIIVVDNNSTDRTAEIAKKNGAKVFDQKNDPSKIDLQKNFGFSKSTGEWILSLDADEKVTTELLEEIKSKTKDKKSKINGYWIPRKNMIFGKWIKSDMWWPDYQLKLFRRGKGRFENNSVHKALEIDGETEKLENPLIHNNYKSVSQFVTKLNNYTSIEANELEGKGYKFNFLDSIRFPVDDFVKTFFLQRGYQDGLHGLVLSMLQAFYMEIVFAKLWEKRGFEEKNGQNFLHDVKSELISSGGKIKYWFLNSLINETGNPFKKTALRIARKITSRRVR